MSLRLRITGSIRIAHDLMSLDGSLAPGAEIPTPGNGRLRFAGVNEAAGADRAALEFVLANERQVDPAALANWLYGQLKDRDAAVRIGLRDVPVEPDALRRAIADAAA